MRTLELPAPPTSNSANIRVQGSTAVVWPLLLSDTAAELAVTWCAAELSRPSHSGETASGQHNGGPEVAFLRLLGMHVVL